MQTDEETLGDEILRRLPCGWAPAATQAEGRLFTIVRNPAGPKYSLLDNGHLAGSHECEGQFFGFVESHLRHSMAREAYDYIFLHAGVVGWEGRAIVIPGRAFSGKTSLVRCLIAAGADYYSDECAVLTADGSVLPYPRRLNVRHSDPLNPQRIDVRTLGVTVGSVPLRIGMLMLTGYNKAVSWQPTPLSIGKAILDCLPHVLSMSKADYCLPVLRASLCEATRITGERGDAHETAGRVLTLATQLWGRSQHAVEPKFDCLRTE